MTQAPHPLHLWHGVRLWETETQADDDAPLRRVSVPTGWGPHAAAALAALHPGARAIRLPDAAEAWIAPIRQAAGDAALGNSLHALLLRRRGAPGVSVWRGEAVPVPRFVLNLPAFFDPADGFDIAGFAAAVETAMMALTLAAPEASSIHVGIADLAGLLAALGIAYASTPARQIAACLAALLRGRADFASSRMLTPSCPRHLQVWPAPPAACPLPALAEAAHLAHQLCTNETRHEATTGLSAPDEAEALLGVETGGVAPLFSPLNDQGSLTQSAMAWLAATGVSPEQALAASLAGNTPFPPADLAAQVAMQDCVGAYLHSPPDAPLRLTSAAAPHRRALPARQSGYTQKAMMGGQKIYIRTIRTGEYADGALGDIAIAGQKDNSALQGMTEAFSQAVSVGLQYGVPLEEFLAIGLNTRFGAAGAVEGNPAVPRAASVLDDAVRHLAAHYLGLTDLPGLPLPDAALRPHVERHLRLVGE